TVTLVDGLWETKIERYKATVTFPEVPTIEPTFSGGYTGEGIGEKLTTRMNGHVVSTSLRGGLLDRESFTVTLKSPEAIFYMRGSGGGNVMRWLVPVLCVLLLLAGVAYWFFFLRSRLLHVHARTFPPETMTPAEAEYVLCNGNIRFSLLLCEWANLGYLTISVPAERSRSRGVWKWAANGAKRSENSSIFSSAAATPVTALPGAASARLNWRGSCSAVIGRGGCSTAQAATCSFFADLARWRAALRCRSRWAIFWTADSANGCWCSRRLPPAHFADGS
ncbi:MAG: hypothetical protein IJT07_02155, partial [Oscillospiraceae bacterium]|nr:hypothetical protein [Oscillospiraceae bacterium]